MANPVNPECEIFYYLMPFYLMSSPRPGSLSYIWIPYPEDEPPPAALVREVALKALKPENHDWILNGTLVAYSADQYGVGRFNGTVEVVLPSNVSPLQYRAQIATDNVFGVLRQRLEQWLGDETIYDITDYQGAEGVFLKSKENSFKQPVAKPLHRRRSFLV